MRERAGDDEFGVEVVVYAVPPGRFLPTTRSRTLLSASIRQIRSVRSMS
ncbi:hypothetical protein [Streptomyces antibioticus]